MAKKYLLILVFCLFGIYVAHAQVNPQDTLNSLNKRINIDLQRWVQLNGYKQADYDNARSFDPEITFLNQEITNAQFSLNSIEAQIANAQTNTDNSADNSTINTDGVNWPVNGT